MSQIAIFFPYWRQNISSGDYFGDSLFGCLICTYNHGFGVEKFEGTAKGSHTLAYTMHWNLLHKQILCSYWQTYLYSALLHHNPLMLTSGLSTVCCDTLNDATGLYLQSTDLWRREQKQLQLIEWQLILLLFILNKKNKIVLLNLQRKLITSEVPIAVYKYKANGKKIWIKIIYCRKCNFIMGKRKLDVACLSSHPKSKLKN
jgi:hypothetical protein